MPLLEETGYMPSKKYVSGFELREHAERIANPWGLNERVGFEAFVRGLFWDDGEGCWVVDVVTGSGEVVKLEAEFVIIATGLLNMPKGPRTFEKVFKGICFMPRAGTTGIPVAAMRIRIWLI